MSVKVSRYRPGVAQRVGRGIALLFHDRGTRRRWVVSSTPRPHFTPGKDPVPIVQEAGWVPGPGWTGVEKLVPTGIRSPHRPAVRSRCTDWAIPAHASMIPEKFSWDKLAGVCYLYLTCYLVTRVIKRGTLSLLSLSTIIERAEATVPVLQLSATSATFWRLTTPTGVVPHR